MKYLLLPLFVMLARAVPAQQVRIHAHNDYQKPEPLNNALRNKAFSIEADVFPADSVLLVAHDKKELPAAHTLNELYLQPLIQLYRQHNGAAGADTAYAPVLMIDIKENGEAAIAQLIKLLAPYRRVFDRSVNTRAVQVVISGDRGPVSAWSSYPPYIFFDGRPYEVYDSAALQRVTFISDSYMDYAKQKDSTGSRLQQLAAKVHAMGKLLRVWAAPDNPASWSMQQQWGIDIINTDKVAECREYFSRDIKKEE